MFVEYSDIKRSGQIKPGIKWALSLGGVGVQRLSD